MQSATAAKRAVVHIHRDLCKGCGLCVDSCPQQLLELSHAVVNRLGYSPANFLAEDCSGCGLCFYACPEPGGLTISPL